jgi:hypothetical protein
MATTLREAYGPLRLHLALGQRAARPLSEEPGSTHGPFRPETAAAMGQSSTCPDRSRVNHTEMNDTTAQKPMKMPISG